MESTRYAFFNNTKIVIEFFMNVKICFLQILLFPRKISQNETNLRLKKDLIEKEVFYIVNKD